MSPLRQIEAAELMIGHNNFGRPFVMAMLAATPDEQLAQGKRKVKATTNAVTREQVTITKNGSPAAVLIGADEWESIQETLFWLSQPAIRESLAEADANVSAGRVFDEAQIRAEFGVPKRGR